MVDDLIGAGASGGEQYAMSLPDDGAGVRNGDNIRAAGYYKGIKRAAGHSSGNRDHVAAGAGEEDCETFTEDFAAGQHVDGVVWSCDPDRFIARAGADDRAGDADRVVAADDEDRFPDRADHQACRADVDVVVAGVGEDGGRAHREQRRR